MIDLTHACASTIATADATANSSECDRLIATSPNPSFRARASALRYQFHRRLPARQRQNLDLPPRDPPVPRPQHLHHRLLARKPGSELRHPVPITLYLLGCVHTSQELLPPLGQSRPDPGYLRYVYTDTGICAVRHGFSHGSRVAASISPPFPAVVPFSRVPHILLTTWTRRLHLQCHSEAPRGI